MKYRVTTKTKEAIIEVSGEDIIGATGHPDLVKLFAPPDPARSSVKFYPIERLWAFRILTKCSIENIKEE